MTRTLRVGVVGLGMMGRHHARVLQGLDGVALVGAADGRGDVHGVAGAVPVVSTVAELVDLGVDAVVVAVPTAEHEAVGLRLAAAGVHALIEKPLASTGAAAERLVRVFEDTGLVGAVGHVERYNPALQELRRRLDDGQLGEVYQIATRRQGPFPARIADVGVVKDLATHDIDVTTWLARAPFVRVGAGACRKSGRGHEDLVTVTGELADGTLTAHLVNWLTPYKERVVVVTGEHGTFVADTVSADLTFHENGTVATGWDQVAAFRGVAEGSSTRFAIPKREPLVVEHEAFRDAVLGRPADVVSLREGLGIVRIAEAVLESARTHAIVEVPS